MAIEDIYNRLYSKNYSNRIIITPLISKKQINGSIIDLRLGTEFILTKKTKFSNLDLRRDDLEGNIKNYQEKVTINIKDNLILHPNQFILGSTLEYIKLPDDVMAYIIGRSSWGRLGLVIATATLINPGFAGIITLELTNVGEVPISLYPGLRIAQISFHLCDFNHKEKEKRRSKYFGSTGPNFSEVYKDRDKILIEKEIDQIQIEKKIDICLFILENHPSYEIEPFYEEITRFIEKNKVKLDESLIKKFKQLSEIIDSRINVY